MNLTNLIKEEDLLLNLELLIINCKVRGWLHFPVWGKCSCAFLTDIDQHLSVIISINQRGYIFPLGALWITFIICGVSPIIGMHNFVEVWRVLSWGLANAIFRIQMLNNLTHRQYPIKLTADDWQHFGMVKYDAMWWRYLTSQDSA